MIRTIVCGATGHVGREVVRFIGESSVFELVGGVNASGEGGCVSHISLIDAPADVIIDFSHHTATSELLKYAVEKNIPAVICTTGHTEDELAEISRAAESIPVFKAANTSLGVAVLTELIKQAAAAFPFADIEIVESHHNRKLDAPSGTALALADAVTEVRKDAYPVFGRHGRSPRGAGEIGIHSLRMGNVVGEHQVIIDACTETITLTHQAHDRAMFAEGALTAAEFIVGKSAGMYGMKQLVASLA